MTQTDYKTMMEQIHAPSDVAEKARRIPMEQGLVKQALRRNAARYMATAAAALLAIFVVTNGVSYAATGETWIEKATVFINGEAEEVDVHMTRLDDGTTVGEITCEVGDDETGNIGISYQVEGGEPGFDSLEINDGTTGNYTVAEDGIENVMVLEGDNGSVVIAPDGVDPIDITKDLQSRGEAVGTFVCDGVTYLYKVSGAPGNYHVTVEPENTASAPASSSAM